MSWKETDIFKLVSVFVRRVVVDFCKLTYRNEYHVLPRIDLPGFKFELPGRFSENLKPFPCNNEHNKKRVI